MSPEMQAIEIFAEAFAHVNSEWFFDERFGGFRAASIFLKNAGYYVLAAN